MHITTMMRPSSHDHHTMHTLRLTYPAHLSHTPAPAMAPNPCTDAPHPVRHVPHVPDMSCPSSDMLQHSSTAPATPRCATTTPNVSHMSPTYHNPCPRAPRPTRSPQMRPACPSHVPAPAVAPNSHTDAPRPIWHTPRVPDMPHMPLTCPAPSRHATTLPGHNQPLQCASTHPQPE